MEADAGSTTAHSTDASAIHCTKTGATAGSGAAPTAAASAKGARNAETVRTPRGASVSKTAAAPAGRTMTCAITATATATAMPDEPQRRGCGRRSERHDRREDAADRRTRTKGPTREEDDGRRSDQDRRATSSAGTVTAAAPLSTTMLAATRRAFCRAGVRRLGARNSRAAMRSPASAAYHAPSG